MKRHKDIAILLLAFCIACFANLFPANADWRKDVGTFRIGLVVGNDSATAISRIEPFRLAIAKALGVDVEFFAAKSYRTLINSIAASRIEYAIFSATAYATAWKTCKCVEPMVIPKSSDGTQSYKSIVITSDGGPEKLTDLAGKKLGALVKGSFAGHKFAVFELEAQGVKLPSQLRFLTSGESTISQFVADSNQALIGWSSLSGDPVKGYSRGTLRQIAAQNGGKVTPFRILWRSSPIPHRPHVVRKSLDGEIKRLLRNVLSRMYEEDAVAYDSIEPLFGGGFVAARHGQFLPVIAYVEALEAAEIPAVGE